MGEVEGTKEISQSYRQLGFFGQDISSVFIRQSCIRHYIAGPQQSRELEAESQIKELLACTSCDKQIVIRSNIKDSICHIQVPSTQSCTCCLIAPPAQTLLERAQVLAMEHDAESAKADCMARLARHRTEHERSGAGSSSTDHDTER
eukprot:338747-Hanusia_phi.AAC.1